MVEADETEEIWTSTRTGQRGKTYWSVAKLWVLPPHLFATVGTCEAICLRQTIWIRQNRSSQKLDRNWNWNGSIYESKKWYTSDQIRSTFRFTAHHLGNLRERPTASTDFPTFILGHEPSWTWANVDNICERFAHLVHTLTKWERCTWNLQHVTWRRLKKGLGDVW